MIDIIIEKENKRGLLLENIKKKINLDNLTIEIIFKIETLDINYENIFDLNIGCFNKGPRLEVNKEGDLSLIYNFTSNPSFLFGYKICSIELNKLYSLKFFFNPCYFKVIFNNETKCYNLNSHYRINANNFFTDEIQIVGGWNDTRKFNCGKLYMFTAYKMSEYCEHGILMPFNTVQNFYNNIFNYKNHEAYEMYDYILKNNKDKNQVNTFMSKENYMIRHNNNDSRFYLENYNYIFNLNIILNKKCVVNCFKKQEDQCELVFSENISSVCNTEKFYYRAYYFKNTVNNNYFVLFTCWEWNLPYFVYYCDDNILYNICLDNPTSTQLNHCSIITTNYIKNKILKTQISELSLSEGYDTFFYGIGFISNIGHYFWQELLGLTFLIETNLIMKIQNIVIGNFDCLDFKDLLQQKYSHLKIIDGNNFDYSNCILTNLNCTYMSKNNILKFKSIYFKHYDNSHYNFGIDINGFKVITFIIRNGLSRNVENNFEIICETINYFLKKYDSKVIFCFTGWFFYGANNNISSNFQNKLDAEIVNIQNDFVESVQLNFPEQNIINKIGINLKELLNIFNLTHFLYEETGTSSMFSTTLFNFKSIWSTNIYNYEIFFTQNILLNNNDKVVPVPKEFIQMINDSSYNIDKNGYLKILNGIHI